MRSNLAIALVHHPVYNKHREVVTTALTNLDLHDIARSARTYGLERFYIVTPSAEQQRLAQRITGHWQEGWGAAYNPDRRSALEIVRIVDDIATARAELLEYSGSPVTTIATGATLRPDSISFVDMRSMLNDPTRSYLLMLGTGWGLDDSCFSAADSILEPISGNSDYNHLSVRSAAAIMLDRLLGRQQ